MLIAGGALRTMRLVNKATSNYHVDAQYARAALNTAHLARAGFFHGFCWTPRERTLHAIDAAFLDTILNYELINIYYLARPGPTTS